MECHTGWAHTGWVMRGKARNTLPRMVAVTIPICCTQHDMVQHGVGSTASPVHYHRVTPRGCKANSSHHGPVLGCTPKQHQLAWQCTQAVEAARGRHVALHRHLPRDRRKAVHCLFVLQPTWTFMCLASCNRKPRRNLLQLMAWCSTFLPTV